MRKAANSEMMKNMEFLVKELHKEWDRSGADKATVMIGIKEAPEVNETIMERIAKQQESIEGAEFTFKELMNLTRDNFVLLRMARKIKSKDDKVNQKGLDYEFPVPLDKDELKLFKEMFKPKL